VGRSVVEEPAHVARPLRVAVVVLLEHPVGLKGSWQARPPKEV
jgi:hypothetical protein